MTGKAENNSSWSDLLEDCLLQGSGESFTEAELKELAELRESAQLLEHLLSEPQTIH